MQETISVEQQKLMGKYPRVEDIDPVDSITNEMQIAGVVNSHKWLEGLHPDAFNKELDINIRRFLVNRQLRMLLGIITSEDTTNARYCLIDRGDMYVWLCLIIEMVIPVFTKYGIVTVKEFGTSVQH